MIQYRWNIYIFSCTSCLLVKEYMTYDCRAKEYMEYVGSMEHDGISWNIMEYVRSSNLEPAGI